MASVVSSNALSSANKLVFLAATLTTGDPHRSEEAVSLMAAICGACFRACFGLRGDNVQNPGETQPLTRSSQARIRSRTLAVSVEDQQAVARRAQSNAELVRQSLVELPEAVTIDSDMPALEELCDRAEQSEERFLQILLDIVKTIPMGNPLSGALVATIVESFPNQHLGVLPKIGALLTATGRKVITLAAARNVLVILSVLADKHAGPGSEAILRTEGLLPLLLAMLEHTTENSPVVQLHALLAIEMFAQTGANKEKLLERGIAEKLSRIEEAFCSLKGASAWKASDGYRKSLGKELLRAQVGFCAMWALDNVFPCEGRKYAVERTDLTDVNAMLDVKDATDHLKLAPHGLEARNDALTFESVRATCFATGSGVWYYEVMLFTAGIMQIGWANEQCAYQSEEGSGIGDDVYSFAYDGCRRLLWLCGRQYRHEHEKWRPGDVLGCLLDLDKMEMCFSINGKWLPSNVKLGRRSSEKFFPAASLMAYQHVQFNFGNMPYRYPPPGECRSFNNVMSMSDAEKEAHRIVPRLVVLEELRREQLVEDTSPRCQICFDDSPNTRLQPCGHKEFCRGCVEKCSTCPLCRCVIAGYEFEEMADNINSDGVDNDNDSDEAFVSAAASPLPSPSHPHSTSSSDVDDAMLTEDALGSVHHG
eukprot:m.507657 g.507657  ORF g.507657 m.507657 type:complete len:651 (+) comp21881_c0_seq11:231-2183(+)